VPDELVERRLLDSQSDFQAPIAQSLFGAAGGNVSGWSGGSVARSRRSSGAGYGDKSTGNSSSRSVRPEEWGSRPTSPQKAHHDWDQDVVQDGGSVTPYFEGQTVSHGIFGTGTVSRVEGTGDDMMVTVDFNDAGRKHLNPRFAPLLPLN